MLVLTRRVGERVVINDQVVIEVLQVKGNRIRLGIQAPAGYSILREELVSQPSKEESREPELPSPDYIASR